MTEPKAYSDLIKSLCGLMDSCGNRFLLLLFFSVLFTPCPTFCSEEKERDHSSTSPLAERYIPLRDPFLSKILPTFTPQELRKTIAPINKYFYKLVSGYDLPNDLSKKPEKSALMGLSFIPNLDLKLKIVEGYITAEYKEYTIPGFIWSNLTSLSNMHSTWWPYIKGTQAEIVKQRAQFSNPEEMANFAISLQGSLVNTVHLTSNFLGEGYGIELAKNLKAPIHTVFLTQNCLKYGGAVAFCENLDLSIQALHIVKNYIGDDGAIGVAQALKNKNVQELSLENNCITDDGIREFADIMKDRKNLTVRLGSNSISEDTHTWLLQQYPSIKWVYEG